MGVGREGGRSQGEEEAASDHQAQREHPGHLVEGFADAAPVVMEQPPVELGGWGRVEAELVCVNSFALTQMRTPQKGAPVSAWLCVCLCEHLHVCPSCLHTNTPGNKVRQVGRGVCVLVTMISRDPSWMLLPP